MPYLPLRAKTIIGITTNTETAITPRTIPKLSILRTLTSGIGTGPRQLASGWPAARMGKVGLAVHTWRMSIPFPEPTAPASSRADVFVGYLDYFRARVIDRINSLAEHEVRNSRLSSGWTPIELVQHLAFVELRWIEWGFEGRKFADPWGDEREGRWYVQSDSTREQVVARLTAQGDHTRRVIRTHNLTEQGKPGPRWNGAEPASLERVLFHLLQEYARHLGHLDIVAELAGAPTGE